MHRIYINVFVKTLRAKKKKKKKVSLCNSVTCSWLKLWAWSEPYGPSCRLSGCSDRERERRWGVGGGGGEVTPLLARRRITVKIMLTMVRTAPTPHEIDGYSSPFQGGE